jgi:hypothetical protein
MTRALRIAFLILCTLILMRPSFGQISITVAFPPPALPIYELPPCVGLGKWRFRVPRRLPGW